MKKDVVERARDNLSSYDYAHAYGCDPMYPVVLIRDLVSEIELLRALVEDVVGVADPCEPARIRQGGLTAIDECDHLFNLDGVCMRRCGFRL